MQDKPSTNNKAATLWRYLWKLVWLPLLFAVSAFVFTNSLNTFGEPGLETVAPFADAGASFAATIVGLLFAAMALLIALPDGPVIKMMKERYLFQDLVYRMCFGVVLWLLIGAVFWLLLLIPNPYPWQVPLMLGLFSGGVVSLLAVLLRFVLTMSWLNDHNIDTDYL